MSVKGMKKGLTTAWKTSLARNGVIIREAEVKIDPSKEEWARDRFSFEVLEWTLGALVRPEEISAILTLVSPTKIADYARILKWEVGVKLDDDGYRWFNRMRRNEKHVTCHGTEMWVTKMEMKCDLVLARCSRIVLRLIDMRTSTVTEECTKLRATVTEECRELVAVDEDFDISCHSIEDFYPLGKEFDITLRVKDNVFLAHRSALIFGCPVFGGMFSHDTIESMTDTVLIDDCEPEGFPVVLFYIYSGRVENLTTENVMSTYYVADKYGLPELTEACSRFIASRLCLDSVCDAFRLSMRHSDEKLFKRAVKFFKDNMTEILPTCQWNRFARENLCQATYICNLTAAIKETEE